MPLKQQLFLFEPPYLLATAASSLSPVLRGRNIGL